jgi:class 3 adenylate cyclase
MSESATNAILAELTAPGANVVLLLQAHQAAEQEHSWGCDPRLYRAFGRELMGAGQFTMAFELVREGMRHHPDDRELLYLSALALARGRNLRMAQEHVSALLTAADLDPKLRAEALSLAGRLKKDRYQARKDGRLAHEAAQLYEAACQLTGQAFPAINAATMSLLAGQSPEAVQPKAQVALGQAHRERQQPGRETDHWLLATLGEASLLFGDVAEAARWYREAVAQAAGRIGDVVTMRRQVQLLQARLPAAEGILPLLDVGTVVMFVGHMIDRPGTDRPAHRFPPDPRLEERVRRAIREELDRLNPAVGYCSGACGSDLLFAEVMLERHKELHLVLPFDRRDFYHTSVDFGLEELRDYRRRFDAVLAQAQVHYGTEESYLGEEGLLEYVSAFAHGLAVVRAAELGVEPWTLAVVDLATPVRRGGTRYFLESWEEHGRRSRIIDLAALRDEVRPRLPAWWDTARPAPAAPPGRMTREVKVMLFADIKNFSQLADQQAPAFFMAFLGEVGKAIQSVRRYPVLCNTWGDGLFLVFNEVADGADFALRLLERIEQVDYATVGLPPDTTARIGLHAGPVYPHWDPLIGRLNFFGSHVNRAARIEPQTPPGCVYASEQVAALLAVAPEHPFACDYVGVFALGKEHDRFRCPLYRLRRADE